MTVKFDATIKRDASGNVIKRNRSGYLDNTVPRNYIIDVVVTEAVAAGKTIGLLKLPANLFAADEAVGSIAGTIDATGYLSNDTVSRQARSATNPAADGYFTEAQGDYRHKDTDGEFDRFKNLFTVTTANRNTPIQAYPGTNGANVVGSDEQTEYIVFRPTVDLTANTRLQVKLRLLKLL